jgi:hypothetical protein
MIRILLDIHTENMPQWAPVASERDGGWCVVLDGNRLVCAIGDALDGESVSAFVPLPAVQVEWRIDGYAHEIWANGKLVGRQIETREFERGQTLHVGSDPWHPRRSFPGTVQVEVTSE